MATKRASTDDVERYRLTSSVGPRTSVILHDLERYQVTTAGHSDVAHRHVDFDQLVYFRDAGLHLMDFEEYSYEANSVGLVPVGAVHRFAGAAGQGSVLNVAADAWPSLADISRVRVLALRAAPFGRLENAWCEKVPELFGMVRLELNRPGAPAILGGLLSTLLAITEEALSRSETSLGSPLVVRYLELVESTFASPASVGDYARELGVSARSLHDATHRSIGRSPSKVVQERRLLEAKRLLVHSSLNVAEVSTAIGFDDASYFSRFFKKHAGESPGEFRSRSRQPS